VNTVERIVACYFQLHRGCLIASDVKVAGGNNRQFDLLAADLRNGKRYHVESSVTHQQNWCPTPAEIEKRFVQKFFGVPRPKPGRNTDHARSKSYLAEIQDAYRQYGFDFHAVTRVWCCWQVRNGEAADVAERLRRIAKDRHIRRPDCEVLSLRDDVLPQLAGAIGRSNYDDDVLRMMSLVEQRRMQVEKLAARKRHGSA
jgi:hypothetical protein